MKIVILDGYTENPGDLSWAGFEALGNLTVYDRTPADHAPTRNDLAEAHGAGSGKTCSTFPVRYRSASRYWTDPGCHPPP